jgi:hypothetical protein
MEGLGHIAIFALCLDRGQAVQCRRAAALHMPLWIRVLPEAAVAGVTIQGGPPFSSSTKLNQVCGDKSLYPFARRIADHGGTLHEPLAN